MNRLIPVLLLVTASTAVAQETPDTFRLQEMVVSATRLPQARHAVSTAVSVITSAEFQQLGLRNAADVLRTVSGAALTQAGSYGAFASMFMRGGESDYVQVLLDGVQINSPGEHFDFANLSLENIDRIEVVKGPVSVLYGSDAVTGVVQLFSKQSEGQPRTQLSAMAGRGDKVGSEAEGAFNSLDLRADVAGGTPRISYAAGVSHFGSEGALAYNNEYRLTSGSARIAAMLGKATDIALSARVAGNRFRYPTDGSGNLVDTNQFHDARTAAIGLDAGHHFTQNTELRAQLSWNRNRDDYDDRPDSPADTLGFFGYTSNEDFRRRALDLRLNRTLRAGTVLTMGGELEQQSREGSSLSLSEFGDFPDASQHSRGNRAGYAQLVAALGNLAMQGGLRVDDNDRFGDFFTWRGGASWRVSPELRMRGSVGTGFKEPRFYEQFATGFVRGNPNLAPETSRSLEAGIDFGRRRWSLGLTAFTQRFRDLIQYLGSAPVDAPNYVNVGEVESTGLELESSVTSGALTLRTSATTLETEVLDAGSAADPLYQNGERLIRRPEQTASIAASYAARFPISAVLTYVGARDDLDYSSFPASRVELPSYFKVDATLRTPEVRGLRGVLKIENVLAEKYQEVLGFPARGRVIFMGVTLD